MINLNGNLVSGRTLSGAAAAGVTKVTEYVSEQVHESPTYFGTVKYNELINCIPCFGCDDITKCRRLI